MVLPQSVEKQPEEIQSLLTNVTNVVEKRDRDSWPLSEASRECNTQILSQCNQLIAFAFHDSKVGVELGVLLHSD